MGGRSRRSSHSLEVICSMWGGGVGGGAMFSLWWNFFLHSIWVCFHVGGPLFLLMGGFLQKFLWAPMAWYHHSTSTSHDLKHEDPYLER